jgi:DNA-binding transcriptional regulator YiaG
MISMTKVKHKPIGKVIAEARERKRLKPMELALMCNVSQASIYAWEASSFVMPKNFAALSKALGIPIRKLEKANGQFRRNGKSLKRRQP